MHVFMFCFFSSPPPVKKKNCFLFLFFLMEAHTHTSQSQKNVSHHSRVDDTQTQTQIIANVLFFSGLFPFSSTHTHTVCWAEQCSKLLASSPNHLPWDHVHLMCSCVCVCVCVRVFTQVDMQHGYTHRRALIALFFRNVGVCASASSELMRNSKR